LVKSVLIKQTSWQTVFQQLLRLIVRWLISNCSYFALFLQAGLERIHLLLQMQETECNSSVPEKVLHKFAETDFRFYI